MQTQAADGVHTDPTGRVGEDLVRAALQRARDIVELAAAEARLAALSGLAMLLLVMIAAAALVVAWVLLVACGLFLFAQIVARLADSRAAHRGRARGARVLPVASHRAA